MDTWIIDGIEYLHRLLVALLSYQHTVNAPPCSKTVPVGNEGRGYKPLDRERVFMKAGNEGLCEVLIVRCSICAGALGTLCCVIRKWGCTMCFYLSIETCLPRYSDLREYFYCKYLPAFFDWTSAHFLKHLVSIFYVGAPPVEELALFLGNSRSSPKANWSNQPVTNNEQAVCNLKYKVLITPYGINHPPDDE